MNRRTVLAAGLAATVLACIGGNSAAQADGWGTRADTAIERAIALDDGKGGVFEYSWLAQAIAHRSAQGWDDPRALAYLDRVMAARLPNGGWSLPYAWDAFGDGTRNPTTTTYTVTLAGHVGPVLLDAYAAGKVNRAVVEQLVAKLQATPRIPVNYRYCYAYSDNPNDVKPLESYCVHNVNAGLAAFLVRAREAGFTVNQWAITNVTLHEAYRYLNGERSWYYKGVSGVLNGAHHNAYNVESMLVLAPGIGRDALDYMMGRPLGVQSGLAHSYLAQYSCAASYRWLSEWDAEMADEGLHRWATEARSTAMAAEVCES